MSVWDTIDTDAIRVIQKIYDRYNIPRIINARNLDFHWRKDGHEGDEQADAIKDLLRYVPGLLRIAAAHPDPAYTIPPVSVPDDAFLVMMNAANTKAPHLDRKGWQQNLRAFAIFAREHPDAVIYLHTDPTRPDGFPIASYLSYLGLDERQTRITDLLAYRAGLIDNEEMARLYTASDVLLSCSMGEGFGLAVPEAMACGTPVIAINRGSMPELIEDGVTGFLVDSIDEAIAAVGRLGEIDRAACRAASRPAPTPRRARAIAQQRGACALCFALPRRWARVTFAPRRSPPGRSDGSAGPIGCARPRRARARCRRPRGRRGAS
jgi:glycosyltransferase involved in cell wall biosynthesis